MKVKQLKAALYGVDPEAEVYISKDTASGERAAWAASGIDKNQIEFDGRLISANNRFDVVCSSDEEWERVKAKAVKALVIG